MGVRLSFDEVLQEEDMYSTFPAYGTLFCKHFEIDVYVNIHNILKKVYLGVYHHGATCARYRVHVTK